MRVLNKNKKGKICNGMNQNKFSSLPAVVIVGSPNVGKSSFFNRLLKKRKAIVEPTAGVTRDRVSANISIGGNEIKLIDTGGIKAHLKEKMDKLVYRQVELALAEADIILFVTDIKTDVTAADYHITSLLRKSSKKIFLLVNKVDNKNLQDSIYDFYQLGIGKPYPVSAINGYGIEPLLEDLGESLLDYKKRYVEKPAKEKITVAIVGRPNVGKSSFINSLFKQDIVIVDEKAGTTRDAVDINFEYKNKTFVLVDTAGMRHKKKLKEVVEVFSIARSKESIRKAEVVLIMLDAKEGLCVDDIKIIEYVIKNYKPCAILVNKWDLIDDITQQDYKKALKARLKLLEWLPIIFTSCVTGESLLNALETASELKERAGKKIRTVELNKLLEQLRSRKRHPLVENKKVNMYYATQTEVMPPAFTLFCNYPKLMRQDYLNYIEKNIRSHFGFFGVPIRLELKER